MTIDSSTIASSTIARTREFAVPIRDVYVTESETTGTVTTESGIVLCRRDGALTGTFACDHSYRGIAAGASGAAIAELAEELMETAMRLDGLRVRSVRDEVEHVATVPLGVPLTVSVRITEVAEPFAFTAMTLQCDGRLVMRARGTFAVMQTYRR